MEATVKKGMTCGAFDLLHAGHIIFLRECRKQCDYLVIALQRDPSLDRPWKNKPVETVEERRIRLEGCRYVDEIVEYDGEEDCRRVKMEVKPDVDFLGADHIGKPFPGADLNIKTVFVPRPHDFSSTNLRDRVKNAQ